MNSPCIHAARWLAIAVLAACQAPRQVADFARNDLFYRDTGFVTKAPGDRAAFVAPVVDARAPAELPTQDRGFPILYGGDELWDRPVGEMLAEVLQRELHASGLFAGTAERPRPDGLVVLPTLQTFTLGVVEGVTGGRSFAEVAFRLQVFGPAAGDGERPILHDKVYADKQTSDLALKPPSPYVLLGRALQRSLGRALTGLDGSNVARSHVPVVRQDGGAPAEAAAPAAR
jgi:hypothetical protein